MKRLLRKLRCLFSWCAGEIDVDETGVYFRCIRCGKITR